MLLKMIQAQWVVEEQNIFHQCETGLLWFWLLRFPFISQTPVTLILSQGCLVTLNQNQIQDKGK